MYGETPLGALSQQPILFFFRAFCKYIQNLTSVGIEHKDKNASSSIRG